VSQVDLDMPEVLWKAYIDFEVAEGEVDHARKLYERLLFRSSHVKVWIAYAKFEYESGTAAAESSAEGETAAAGGPGNIVAARGIFTKG
jgi:crooked neck